MPQMTRDEAIAEICGSNLIMSATWQRRTDKKIHRCPNCELQVARHNGNWVCKSHGVVIPFITCEARKGDTVSLQFISKIRHEGTKNWTPVNGGQCFGVDTKEKADQIKRTKGLVGVLKMSETGTGDLRAEPRTIPVFDIQTLKIEGVTYDVVD